VEVTMMVSVVQLVVVGVAIRQFDYYGVILCNHIVDLREYL
jgi:hypothetical protein